MAEYVPGLVSVVMASYNTEDFIVEAIESVRAQTYVQWELIVVDDCSIDDSVSVVSRIADADSRISLVVNQSNVGPGETRNAGIEAARGEFLTFLDSDDLWNKEFIRRSVDAIRHTGSPFVFSSYARVDTELKPLLEPYIVPPRVTYHDLLETCPISCLTAMIHVGAIGKYFMPDIRKRQDYVLWLRILKDIEEARGLPDVLATYRMRPNSVSRNKLKAMYYIWRVYREHERLSLPESAYYLMRYGHNALVKYRR